MLNVTLRQLRYFDALARHGHFGRAAETCAISQPALSMQIKEMEEALGGMLLERSARQVALTRFGEEIAERVRDILRSVDELGDFARASRCRKGPRGRLPDRAQTTARLAPGTEQRGTSRTLEYKSHIASHGARPSPAAPDAARRTHPEDFPP